jgi:Holliday junction resolvasome RuvABC endonuclease subunit
MFGTTRRSMPEVRRRQPFIVGADLSSSLLAFACQLNGRMVLRKYKLGTPFNPLSCGKALDAAMEYLNDVDQALPSRVERLAYIEAPVVAGARNIQSTIKQSFVSGAVQACFVKAGFQVYTVPITTWKKIVTGSGGAKKEQIAPAVCQRYPEVTDVIRRDQDLADACGVFIYGQFVEQRRRSMEAVGRL